MENIILYGFNSFRCMIRKKNYLRHHARLNVNLGKICKQVNL